MANNYNNIDNLDIDTDIDSDFNADFNSDFDSDLKQDNEKDPFPVHVFFIELAKMYTNRIDWQWHPEMEVIIINHGEVIFMTNDTKITLTAGEGVIINSNTMHSVVPATDNTDCSMYSVVFHPSYIIEESSPVLYQKYIEPVITNKAFNYFVLKEEDTSSGIFLDSINEVIAYNLLKNPGYEITTRASLCLFWNSLFPLASPNKKAKKISKVMVSDEKRTKEMIEYIKKHYSEKITLDELADSAGISRGECCRCFKRSLNIKPFEYILKYRIATAALLIKNNDPIAESFASLAFHVGFNNASYFNKIFREFLNCTPSEFKKKIKTNPGFDPFSNIHI